MGGSLIRWIFQPKSINTGSEKIRFTTFFFLGGGLQGAVYQIQKSLIMAALAARCHLIRMGLVSLDQSWNFYHNQLPGFSVTITTEFSFFGLNEITRYWFMWAEPFFRLHCKKKLGSFPHFSFPSWTRFHFHSCLSLHLHCKCEPVFRTFHGMTYL